jgi:hypothetical protein
MFTKILLLLIKISVIAFFTMLYVTPLFVLFYIIIFQNLDLLNQITLKFYSISFFIGYALIFVSTTNWVKNDLNEQNKGV